jgi:hypothetical protein
MDEKEREKKELTALGFWRGNLWQGALVDGSGDNLGVSREGEVDDGVQGVTASSRAWSTSSFAFGNGAGRRLERCRASVSFGR